MTLAAILLGIAILGGITLLGLRFRGGNPPILFAMVHGLVAAAGLVALAVAVLGSGAGGTALVALLVLVLAALLGAGVVSFHLRRKLIPLAFAMFHGLVAILGYVFLLSHIYHS